MQTGFDEEITQHMNVYKNLIGLVGLVARVVAVSPSPSPSRSPSSPLLEEIETEQGQQQQWAN